MTGSNLVIPAVKAFCDIGNDVGVNVATFHPELRRYDPLKEKIKFQTIRINDSSQRACFSGRQSRE